MLLIKNITPPPSFVLSITPPSIPPSSLSVLFFSLPHTLSLLSLSIFSYHFSLFLTLSRFSLSQSFPIALFSLPHTLPFLSLSSFPILSSSHSPVSLSLNFPIAFLSSSHSPASLSLNLFLSLFSLFLTLSRFSVSQSFSIALFLFLTLSSLSQSFPIALFFLPHSLPRLSLSFFSHRSYSLLFSLTTYFRTHSKTPRSEGAKSPSVPLTPPGAKSLFFPHPSPGAKSRSFPSDPSPWGAKSLFSPYLLPGARNPPLFPSATSPGREISVISSQIPLHGARYPPLLPGTVNLPLFPSPPLPGARNPPLFPSDPSPWGAKISLLSPLPPSRGAKSPSFPLSYLLGSEISLYSSQILSPMGAKFPALPHLLPETLNLPLFPTATSRGAISPSIPLRSLSLGREILPPWGAKSSLFS
ncbi:hypothetical protein C7M84_013993 [Penaeus vannamei]|uniref:Uncharacterized protein n=1 Tax=Penaeus vannamei TaxID=6689 RepID=A0A423SUP1_PENVA|nr:hypothetical protein C7M84_013993 [Penaeus vannamei]